MRSLFLISFLLLIDNSYSQSIVIVNNISNKTNKYSVGRPIGLTLKNDSFFSIHNYGLYKTRKDTLIITEYFENFCRPGNIVAIPTNEIKTLEITRAKKVTSNAYNSFALSFMGIMTILGSVPAGLAHEKGKPFNLKGFSIFFSTGILLTGTAWLIGKRNKERRFDIGKNYILRAESQ
ncbi:MAG: hypothetical protein HY840_08055 [Bacteroidetes bacterium]|nr:hypothetical protein [Bacteroidota bacterium]